MAISPLFLVLTLVVLTLCIIILMVATRLLKLALNLEDKSRNWLELAEKHGNITDIQQVRTTDTLDKTNTTLENIKGALVEDLPAKVAEVVKDTVAPVIDPGNPPQRRSTDKKEC